MNTYPAFDTPGRRIGYARVSTKDQKLDIQIDVLKAVQCDEIFTDHGVSGANAKRPGLDAALAEMKPGDTLVVMRMCRLGRSVLHLADLVMRFKHEGKHFWSIHDGINTATYGGRFVFHVFAAVSELQRDIIRENTVQGIEAARARGKRIGRPPKMDEFDVMNAHAMMHQRGATMRDIAVKYDVTISTVGRAFERFGLGVEQICCST